MGDSYYYNSGVRLSIAGGGYDYIAEVCGPLAFAVNHPLTLSDVAVGSSRAL